VNEPTNKPTIAINLLTQDEFSQSAFGKVMLWALSIGRYVVVFTELIVILSFLSRFKLDRDLTDLNEAISRQKAIILSYGNLENDFLYAQSQLELVRQAQAAFTPNQILDMLSQTTPPDVKLNQLQLTNTGIHLSATALSPQGFVRFITNLLQHEYVNHVSLGGVSSKDQGMTISFEVIADLEKPPPNPTNPNSEPIPSQE
jgi:Tfp pilus assembly protein PilN